VEMTESVRGACRLHIQSQNHFVPKDEGSIFLQGTGLRLEEYMLSQPNRLQPKTTLLKKMTTST